MKPKTKSQEILTHKRCGIIIVILFSFYLLLNLTLHNQGIIQAFSGAVFTTIAFAIFLYFIRMLVKRKEKEKKTLNFRWVKGRLTFDLICPNCNEASGCYSMHELFINQKNGDECGNCGSAIPIIEDNIQYAELNQSNNEKEKMRQILEEAVMSIDDETKKELVIEHAVSKVKEEMPHIDEKTIRRIITEEVDK